MEEDGSMQILQNFFQSYVYWYSEQSIYLIIWKDNMPDNPNTQIALLKQSMQNVEKQIDEMKKETKESFTILSDQLTNFIDSAHLTFATKEEHRQNKIDIQELKNTQWKVWMTLIGTFWTLFLATIWVILKKLWIL